MTTKKDSDLIRLATAQMSQASKNINRVRSDSDNVNNQTRWYLLIAETMLERLSCHAQFGKSFSDLTVKSLRDLADCIEKNSDDIEDVYRICDKEHNKSKGN